MPPLPICISAQRTKKYGAHGLGFISSVPMAKSGGLNIRKKLGKIKMHPTK
jgi:hypothetical protein